MSRIATPLVVAALLGSLAASTVAAQTPRIRGGIAYVSGGIGDDQQLTMEALRSQYNLHLLFAQQGSGAFFVDVSVQISDASGMTVLNAMSEGPYFFARLAPGRYSVSVSHEGQPMTRTVLVPATGAADVNFYWPGSALTVPLPASSAGAGQTPPAQPASPPTPAVSQAPQVQTAPQGNITFVSGGGDQASQQQMEAIRSQYNLRLVFPRQGTGTHFAFVPVQILDAGGRTVLNTVSSGPLLFARVPPGHYTVVASHNGQSVTRAADVPADGGVELDYYWAGS